MDLDRTYRPRNDVRHRSVGCESVVVRMEDAEVLVLSEVGGRVLQLLDGNRNLDGVHRQLLEEYEVEPATLEADLEEFIRALVQKGVVEEISRKRGAEND